uniref:SARAH domain-containing protein n=2 Tax=Timema TaxID=61471 RepID=A0A7R8ZDL1_TIMDO|nr:unnamed protein product [Timema douglasi]
MIAEAREIRDNQSYRNNAVAASTKQNHTEESDDDELLNNKTMVQYSEDSGTLVPTHDLLDVMLLKNLHSTAQNNPSTLIELQSNLGTMVINSDTEEEPTMKRRQVKWNQLHEWMQDGYATYEQRVLTMLHLLTTLACLRQLLDTTALSSVMEVCRCRVWLSVERVDRVSYVRTNLYHDGSLIRLLYRLYSKGMAENMVKAETLLSAVIVLPNPVGTVLPNPVGTVLPNPFGTVLPNPAGTVLPNPAGTVLPNPAGIVLPNPSGTVLPNPAGTVLPNPGGTVLSNPAGIVLPNPAGNLLLSPSQGWNLALRCCDAMNFTIMPPSDFDILLSMVEPHIPRQDTTFRDTIAASTRLSLILLLLARDDSYQSLMYQFKISVSSISVIIPEVCVVIVKAHSGYVKSLNEIADNLTAPHHSSKTTTDEELNKAAERHDTGPGESGKKYRPLFLDHFDKKDEENIRVDDGQPLASHNVSIGTIIPDSALPNDSMQQDLEKAKDKANNHAPPYINSPQMSAEERQHFQNHLQRQLNQISGAVRAGPLHHSPLIEPFQTRHNNDIQAKLQRAFVERDFEFLKFLSYEDLQQRMVNLDTEMEREIDELKRRYQTKRQPILDAMDQKRKRQQNF